MRVTVQAFTGQEYCFDLDSAATVSVLKSLIWKREKVLPYHQGLIFRGRQLDKDELPLKDYGITCGSKLSLALLARSGPLRTVVPESPIVATTSKDYGSLFKEQQSLESSCFSQSGGELDLSFTAERRQAAKQRAEENLRTMAKMRELRQSLERLKLEKKNRTSVDIPADVSSRIRRSSCSNSTVGNNGKMKCPTEIAPALLSAPEDTSAKESSAGETEYEEWRPSGPISLKDYLRNQAEAVSSLNTEQEGIVSLQSYQDGHGNVNSRRCLTGQPGFIKSGQSRGGLFGVASSSSEPESAGAVWTGSEVEEDALYTAEEGVTEEKQEVEMEECAGESFDAFYSGNSDVERGSAPYFPQKEKDTPSDPSELSSGMIICDLTNDFRRVKVKRRHHLPGKSATGCSSARGIGNVETMSSKPPKRSQWRGQMSGWKNRPRSRPRQLGGIAVSGCPHGKVGPSTGESSSDEKEGWSSGGGAKPTFCSYGLAGNSLVTSRKLMGQQGRFLKYRPGGNSVGQMESQSVVRHHKLPQSSQSQLRCNACGCKLSISATYQCRCGKTLCIRHRSQDTHVCSYDVTSKCSDTKRTTLKIQEPSD